MHSRIQVRIQWRPIIERDRCAALIAAGCAQPLIADSGLEILRLASRELPRQAGRILNNALRLAVPRGLNHLPDDLLQLPIAEIS